MADEIPGMHPLATTAAEGSSVVSEFVRSSDPELVQALASSLLETSEVEMKGVSSPQPVRPLSSSPLGTRSRS
ncbi:MAG TPA: hypothetical protein VKC62_07320, partial [Gaiellaceae bacterium]|nr:hypothetical protein [Gaiellaceae bacterium]